MTDTKPPPPFEYPSSLQDYMINEKEFYLQNPQIAKLATGAVVFNSEGKILIVQRAANEKAFPDCWEIPGGKVDDTDETILHAVARELKEETGLDAIRFVRKVGEFEWDENSKRTGIQSKWKKIIFEVEVKDSEITLDPEEHQAFLFAAEEDIVKDKVVDVPLTYIAPDNKSIKLEAFRLKREGTESRLQMPEQVFQVA
ncbi:NUDIX hydrolase domain-like protein [Clohesyomyces aquaticus]|uniref:NUDIX hydrolase domain-like protein n=1 Tax=Clohesyomyces aquaticus TaxID=1231657 RepID=A0A1Y1Z1F3_9PLEO|nr:NUDIX hydrolase domain-like protein [Clohesyomyces aquaticus]